MPPTKHTSNATQHSKRFTEFVPHLVLAACAAVASAQDSYKVGQRVLELLSGFQSGEQQLAAAQKEVAAAQSAVDEAAAALERARALSVVKRQRTE